MSYFGIEFTVVVNKATYSRNEPFGNHGEQPAEGVAILFCLPDPLLDRLFQIRLGNAQLASAMRELEAALRAEQLPNPLGLLSFSATRRTGVDEAREIIADWLRPGETT